MSQYIVSLLAQRPESELREIREKARAEVARLHVEIEQIEQALAKQAQHQARRSARPNRRKSTSGGTRERVLTVVGAATEDTTSPAQIVAAVRAQGVTVSSAAIRNMIRRLVDEGEIVRIREGAYKLTSRNGSASQESDAERSENGTAEPLLTAATAQEGQD
jgi:hypothetical protein